MEAESRHNIKQEIIVLSCTICAGDARYTGRNILLTKLLLNNFVSSAEKEIFRPLKIFDFCSSCVKLLEDLRDLEYMLETIQNKLKTKKTEIKIKILQNRQRHSRKYNHGIFEKFRKISTRDLCPRVQMYKNNKLHRRRAGPKSKTGQHNMVLKSKATLPLPLPLSPEKEDQYSDTTRSLPGTPSPSTATNKVIFTEDQIKSETVSIPPEDSLSLFEEETIIKCEPWKEQIESFEIETTECLPVNNDFNSAIEETPSIIASSSNYATSTVQEYNAQSTTINHNAILNPSASNSNPVPNWMPNPSGQIIISSNRPPLSYLELVILALVTSENMQLPIQHICDFIDDNFPYYKVTMDGNWKNSFKINIPKSTLFIPFYNQVDGNCTYGIRHYNMSTGVRRSMHGKLPGLTDYMAYPDRIPLFQKSLLREQPPNPETVANTNGVTVQHSYSVQNVNPNETTNFWIKPPLSISQISILAMVTSPSMNVDLKDILRFIVTNFPYYENFKNWECTLKYYLEMYSFMRVREYASGGQLLCTLIRCDDYHNSLKLISDILMVPTMSNHMAFPVLLVSLRDSVLREMRYMAAVHRNSPNIPSYPANVSNIPNYPSDTSNTSSYSPSMSNSPSNSPNISNNPINPSNTSSYSSNTFNISNYPSNTYNGPSCSTNISHSPSYPSNPTNTPSYPSKTSNAPTYPSKNSNISSFPSNTSNTLSYLSKYTSNTANYPANTSNTASYPANTSKTASYPTVVQNNGTVNSNSNCRGMVYNSPSQSTITLQSLLESPAVNGNLQQNYSPNYTQARVNRSVSSAVINYESSNVSQDLQNSVQTQTWNALPCPWSKPMLSIDVLCILAILNSENQCLTMQDIHVFINENFPYFKAQTQIKCRLEIKLALEKPTFKAVSFGKQMESAGSYPNSDTATKNSTQLHLYTLNDSHVTDDVRQQITELLNMPENVKSMAYPGCVRDITTSIWRKRPFPQTLHFT